MNDNLKKYRATKNTKLSEYPTHEVTLLSNNTLEEELASVSRKIADFQNMMYAHGKYGVLVCLQGMDTSGKDSMIREIFKGFNSRGIITHSFKTPTSKELAHDYLWRHYMALPERGKFSIFNRTHYENVLVTRVHSEYILKENIPKIDSVRAIPSQFWAKRFKQINDFEKHITQNGIIVFKFFLHISKEEQRLRLLNRLEKPSKNWKFSKADIEERQYWEDYQHCYQEILRHTSTKRAPWYIIPSDNKKASRLLVAKILWENLKKYKDIRYPELNEEVKAQLQIYKTQLENEKP